MSKVRDVKGIGSKKSKELRSVYNIRTINSLKRYVRKIPNIITESQRQSLKYHEKTNKKISYSEATKHINFISKNIPNILVAGSYRRKEKWIGDIDIIIFKDLEKVVNKLKEKKYIIAVLSMGESKFSGIVKLPNSDSHRRIDIMKSTPEEKPFMLLYLTGDFVQNIIMRQRAKKISCSLSQNGLVNILTGKLVKGLKTEKDIFKYLNMEYKEPHEESHKGSEYEMLSKLN